jgi:hypothetical protein
VNICTKNKDRRIIPVILLVINKINYSLPWFLADYQWVEFINADDEHAISKLLLGLRNIGDITFKIGENPYKGLESFGVEETCKST